MEHRMLVRFRLIGSDARLAPPLPACGERSTCERSVAKRRKSGEGAIPLARTRGDTPPPPLLLSPSPPSGSAPSPPPGGGGGRGVAGSKGKTQKIRARVGPRGACA